MATIVRNIRKIEFPEHRPKEIENEVVTLQSRFSEIIKNVGKFVLVQGDTIVAYFDSYREATNEGYRRFGLENFLVRHVKETEIPIRAMRCGLRRMGAEIRIRKPNKA